MGAALATMYDAPEVGRYAVSVWVIGSDDPVVQHAKSPGEAAELVMWAKGDPSMVRAVVVDTANGRRLTVWNR